MTLPAAVAAKKDNNNKKQNAFNNPIELPPMQIANAADRAKEEAIAALEISKDGKYAKCQCCGQNIRIVGKMARPQNDRIATLEKRIRYLEKYPRGGNNTAAVEIKHAKEELADLLKEEEKRDKLRSIPLLSSKITGYRLFCHSCWDQAYLLDRERRKKERSKEDS
jgi:hypothetical protein